MPLTLANQCLNTLMHSLKAQLADALAGQPPIVRAQSYYALNLHGGVKVDVLEFASSTPVSLRGIVCICRRTCSFKGTGDSFDESVSLLIPGCSQSEDQRSASPRGPRISRISAPRSRSRLADATPPPHGCVALIDCSVASAGLRWALLDLLPAIPHAGTSWHQARQPAGVVADDWDQPGVGGTRR